MEYEGAGSFWSQLAAPHGDQMQSAIPPRKIDELLKNENSSLVDILSDEEAISEFRSANPKMVSRITSASGLDLLLRLITSCDIPKEVSETQRLQLPYIASELVACEVDGLLDAMTRVIPGIRTPLDRLFDCFFDESESSNSTVLGYVVRVLLVLVNRRVGVIDGYVGQHHAAVMEGLMESLRDKSVADFLFRLCLDEDIKQFKLSFNRLVAAVNTENGENIVWMLDSMFGRPLLGSSDKLNVFYNQVREDLVDKGGLPLLVEKAFSPDPSIASRSCMEILSLLVQFTFTRPALTETVTPLGGLEQAWESFSTSMVTGGLKRGVTDDESCLFDDEEPPVPLPAASVSPTVAFGQKIISACLSRVTESFFSGSVLGDIQQLHSFLKLLARSLKFASEPLIAGSLLGKIVVESFTAYPNSTAIHILGKDCVVEANLIAEQLDTFSIVFIKNAPALLLHRSCRSHVDRILHFIHSKGIVQLDPELKDAVNRWKQVDSRLADRDKKPVSRVSSPQGVTPIIDLDPPAGWSGGSSPRLRQSSENWPGEMLDNHP